MTEAFIGYKTKLEDVTNAKTIGKVISISGPNMTSEQVDATTMDPAGDYYRKFIAGLRDPGEVSINGACDYADVGQAQLYTNFGTQSVVAYMITLPEGTTWEFDAVMTALAFDTPMEDKATFSATFKISGIPKLTPSS